jgi:hypothetical protein
MARPATAPKLVALAVAWVALTRIALDYGALALPASLARQMTLEEFLPLAQTVSAALTPFSAGPPSASQSRHARGATFSPQPASLPPAGR